MDKREEAASRTRLRTDANGHRMMLNVTGLQQNLALIRIPFFRFALAVAVILGTCRHKM